MIQEFIDCDRIFNDDTFLSKGAEKYNYIQKFC